MTTYSTPTNALSSQIQALAQRIGEDVFALAQTTASNKSSLDSDIAQLNSDIGDVNEDFEQEFEDYYTGTKTLQQGE